MSAAPSTVAVRGEHLNPPVYRIGSGEPLLYFHHAGGLAMGPGPELQALSQHYEIIAPVHPGWDDTEGLEDIDDIHDLVLYYQDFCDRLGLTSFNLVGHSLGGLFAAEFAAARPDLVKKLILICPVGLWMDENPVTDIFILLPNELPGYMFGDPESPFAKMMAPDMSDLDAVAERMYLQMANMAATGKFIWPIPDKGLKKRIHRIKAETLILWGENDRIVPVEYAALFQEKIPGSQVITYPGAGHLVTLEKSAEVARDIQSFLG